MPYILTRVELGEVGVKPGDLRLQSLDTLDKITAPGYLSNTSSTGIQILPTDIISATYVSNTGTPLQGLFTPVFNEGNITLNQGEVGGDVVGPVTISDPGALVVFGADGQHIQEPDFTPSPNTIIGYGNSTNTVIPIEAGENVRINNGVISVVSGAGNVTGEGPSVEGTFPLYADTTGLSITPSAVTLTDDTIIGVTAGAIGNIEAGDNITIDSGTISATGNLKSDGSGASGDIPMFTDDAFTVGPSPLHYDGVNRNVECLTSFSQGDFASIPFLSFTFRPKISTVLQGDGDPQVPFGMQSFNPNLNLPGLMFASANGTADAPTAITTGQSVLQIFALGYDGTDYLQCGQISFTTNGVTDDGIIPTKVGLQCMKNTGDITMVLTSDYDGSVSTQHTKLDNGFGQMGISTSLPEYALDIANDMTETPSAAIQLRVSTNIPTSPATNNWLLWNNAGTVGLTNSDGDFFPLPGSGGGGGIVGPGTTIIGGVPFWDDTTGTTLGQRSAPAVLSVLGMGTDGAMDVLAVNGEATGLSSNGTTLRTLLGNTSSTGDYTADANDVNKIISMSDDAGAVFTCPLLSAVTTNSQIYIFANTDTGVISIETQGSDAIVAVDGVLQLAPNQLGMIFKPDGGAAWIFTRFADTSQNILSFSGDLTLTANDVGSLIYDNAGAATDTITLPVVTTVPLGGGFDFLFAGSGFVEIEPSGGDTLVSPNGNGILYLASAGKPISARISRTGNTTWTATIGARQGELIIALGSGLSATVSPYQNGFIFTYDNTVTRDLNLPPSANIPVGFTVGMMQLNSGSIAINADGSDNIINPISGLNVSTFTSTIRGSWYTLVWTGSIWVVK